ncbi:MAG: hypothetical protein HY314_04825 [Acidobacteria bacterium]|nr:hypothetical protein [Acidobacteriota bacterium]
MRFAVICVIHGLERRRQKEIPKLQERPKRKDIPAEEMVERLQQLEQEDALIAFWPLDHL